MWLVVQQGCHTTQHYNIAQKREAWPVGACHETVLTKVRLVMQTLTQHKARSVTSLVTFFDQISWCFPHLPTHTYVHTHTLSNTHVETHRVTTVHPQSWPGHQPSHILFQTCCIRYIKNTNYKRTAYKQILLYKHTHMQYSRFLHNSRRARSSGVAARFLGSAIFFSKLIINCRRGLFFAHAQSS